MKRFWRDAVPHFRFDARAARHVLCAHLPLAGTEQKVMRHG